MTLLEGKNGHLVSSPDAIRCPECAEIILAASQGNGFGIFLAAIAAFAASTMWLIGCIAVDVRIGRDES